MSADWAAAFISAGALAFTLLSFWWMYWRAGKLQVGDLQHFAAGMATLGGADETNEVLIGLPLVIFNTGASPVVIESLRLCSPPEGLGMLHWQRIDRPLWPPEPVADGEFFLPHIVRPNEAIKENFVFATGVTDRRLGLNLYSLDLEAKLFGHRDWLKLKRIDLDFRGRGETVAYQLVAGYRPYRAGPEPRPALEH